MKNISYFCKQITYRNSFRMSNYKEIDNNNLFNSE